MTEIEIIVWMFIGLVVVVVNAGFAAAAREIAADKERQP